MFKIMLKMICTILVKNVFDNVKYKVESETYIFQNPEGLILETQLNNIYPTDRPS